MADSKAAPAPAATKSDAKDAKTDAKAEALTGLKKDMDEGMNSRADKTDPIVLN